MPPSSRIWFDICILVKARIIVPSGGGAIPLMSTRPGVTSKHTGDAASGHRDVALPKKRGRRPSHTEQWTKVTVVLFDRQIVFLDRLCADIRAASGVAVSRAHVIRALIDALTTSELDLTATRSEADLRALITGRLAKK